MILRLCEAKNKPFCLPRISRALWENRPLPLPASGSFDLRGFSRLAFDFACEALRLGANTEPALSRLMDGTK